MKVPCNMAVKHSGLRILVVEDSLLIVKRIWGMVSELEGVTLMTHAKDGFEALLLSSQIQHDVILLDIKIPGKSGMDVLPELRKSTKATIVMLTNYSDNYYRNLCMELGADFFLDKSNDFERINDILSEIQKKAA